MDTSVRQIARIELRRAVLGVLLNAPRPLSIADIERCLADHGLMPYPYAWGGRTVRKLFADLLAHQWRIGRVQRVARGQYQIVPSAISPSMRYRCGRVLRDAARRRTSGIDSSGP